MAKYSICILDDNLSEAENCMKNLSMLTNIGDIHILTNPFDLPDLLRKTNIDILFLDIEMPGVSGLDIYRSLDPKIRPVVVLVTWHDEFALEGFQINAADYVLKPTDFVSLANAVTKALRILGVSVTTYNIPEPEYTFFPVKGGGRQIFIFKDIVAAVGYGNYTTVYTRGGNSRIVGRSLLDLEGELPRSIFLRVHQSYIANLLFASKYDQEGLHMTEFPEKNILPIGRTYKPAIAAMFRRVSTEDEDF